MGTGDYFCVTLRGGAPWGFTLQEGDGDTYRPFIVSQVDEGGRAFLAGVQEGDEVVSLNGEPCADLSLLRARASIDTTVSCLQLLLKRTLAQEEYESEEAFCGQMDSSDAAFESTTLHIITPKNGTQASRQLHISESYEEVESDGDAEFLKGPQLLSTTLHVPSSGDDRDGEPGFKEHEEAQLCFSPGELVELQVSLSEQTLDDVTCTSLGSALGIQGELSTRETTEMIQDPATSTSTTTTTSLSAPCPVRQPLGQHGVVLSSPSMLGQVEVILQQQPAAASGAGRSLLIPDDPGEEGGCSQEDAGSFTVSFVIPPEETTPAEEQDSDSEVDQGKPNKHHARHARLRRSESLSEKQVKEAKSKCKRIALLLTAAPPNPNNKGVLMFKKHRLRAKKYTLVSYGTGEDEPEYSDEEDGESEDDKEETHTVEFTLVAPRDSEIEKHILENSSKGVLTINWDKGLLEIERNLNNQAEMECLPETKGKGAVMFAQRRLRMDEIAAEHEELRRQGIPVEGVQEVEEKVAEQSYLQCTTDGHAYMDVNMHQQSQQQQQYQQYQEQQYHEQQQHYQQEQQQYQTQYQQQYEQQHYQQQQMYQQQQQRQQQEYHDQQQMQLYSTNVNGTVHPQTSEMQSSCSNRTAKPFLVDNLAPALYSPAVSCVNQDSVGQGEQIASRDERISTPAIKTGVLSDARKRNTGKPMFTFKEAPKVSPNPALLNLLNRNNKKLGFESGPEEDYLSLGAEACNFLQSPMKNKVPPPVAPKPMINSSSVQLSPQLEVSNQDIPQQAENSVSTPAVAPTTDDHPAPELQPTPAPAPEPTPPPAPQEVPASTTTMEQHTWAPSEPEPQQQAPQVTTQEELGHMNSTIQPETAPVTSWAAAQTHVQPQPSTNLWQKQPQEPTPSPPPPQPSWATCQPTQTQAQSEIPTNTWTHQNQPSWKQQQDQAQAQTNAQPSWTQPQEQTQPQPPMAHHHEQQNLQQMQPTWGQPQDKLMQQQPQAPWAQPQTHSQPQPPWMQQPQQKSGAQPSWVQQIPSDSQQQLPWAQQPERQAPQQVWPQPQALEQPQPPWISAQPQQQLPINAWPPSQTQVQVQPPWIQPSQAQPPPQPQVTLNPWAPVPAQDPVQPSWAQHPSENCQQPMGSWAQEQNVAQHQPPWAQQVPPHPIPQPNWQQSTPDTSSQPPMNIMPPAPTQPQASVWGPQSQQKPVNVSTPMVNTHPSPKPWHPPQNAPQNRSAPPAPQRMHSFAITQRASSPINPMATVLNPSSQGSSLDMPTVRGKGADMFAKRQSRMEKFIVDSDTVEANKASRSTSPAASLPNEWKYTPNVRAPPSRSYNPIQSPFYPPAAIKQPPSSSPSTKATKKGKDKQKPAPKPLSVVDVMKHQPYQLSSSLFIYGPAAETEKSPAPKPECSPPNPPIENQAVRYGQMAPTQPTESFNAPYPQQAYGMPMQPMVQDGHYQQNPANVYPQPNPYQQPPGGIYQQAYNHQYQQPVPPAYHPQALQSPNLPYHQAAQPPYQPANSPPYLATPSVLQYQPQPPSSYVAPSFPFAARPESASGGSGGSSAAPKPKFTANKSSAQAFGRSYSLSPQARLPYTGQRSASASSSPKPPARASTTSCLERGHKPLSPWQAASRHPLGLVDEAFAYQDLQHTLASNVCLAAQRKTLPEPPAEWKARVSYQAPEKRGSYTWSQSQTRSQSRPPLPSSVTPTGSTVSTESSPAGFGSLPRQWIQNQTCSPRRAPLPSFVPPTRSTVSPAASPAGYGSLPRQWIQSQTRSQSRASLPSFVPPTRSTISPADSPAGYGSLPRQWIQSQTRSQSRASLPSFVPPTRSTISPADSPARYGSLPRQWQPQRSVAGANPGTSVSYPEYKTPVGKQTYKSVFTSNTWSWRR